MRTLRHGVEALPRLTLTVAQLKNERDAQLALSGGQWNPEESLHELKGLVPDSVLHQLAPFQRDAVAFVMRKKGRALVADEMGLGTPQTWSGMHEVLSILGCRSPALSEPVQCSCLY